MASTAPGSTWRVVTSAAVSTRNAVRKTRKSITAEPPKLATPAAGGWMVPLRASVTMTVVRTWAVPMTMRMARPRSRERT